jgi:WD40 repeat protein
MGNEAPSLPLPSAPYRGIEPFRFVDQPIFSARTGEVRKLVRLITIYRGIFFYGESGAGKSSLINAGLIPALRNEGFAPERVRVQPIAGHELVVERISLTDEAAPPFLPSIFGASADKKTPEPARVVLSVEEFVRCIRKAPMPEGQDGIATSDAVPVLFFDQFEELITLFEEAPDSREKFNQAREIQGRVVEMLLGLLGDPNLSIKLVLSFREDYLAKVCRRLAAAPQLGEQAFRLSFPPETVVRKIIRGPFESAEIPAGHFTRRLSEPAFDALEFSFRELSDTGTINLTEVQIACLALWENEEEEKAFLKEGDHQEAVRRLFGNYLDRALNRLEQRFQKPAITALTCLVTSSGTRNIVSEDDLLGNVVRDDHLTQPDAREVLNALSRTTRLVFRQTRGDSAFYEISSEFLIPWITEKRQARERDAELEKQREKQELELAQARRVAAARRQRITFGAITFGLVVAIAFGIVAWLTEKKTREVASRADVSLARYSREGGKNAQALAQLARALRLNARNRDASGLTVAMLTQISSYDPLIGSIRHLDVVNSAEFSPDGQRIVTASGDNTARLWDALSGKPIAEPIRHLDVVNSAEFSPDGQRIVTASGDNTARLWDALSGKPIAEPMRHEAVVYSAQFSPDGRRIVTASGDNTARLWDALSGKPIAEPMKHEDVVYSAQFSPDGQRVVTASADRTVRVWDALSGKPIGEPMRHEGRVYSAQFSPNGQLVVTASGDRAARVWDAASGKRIGEPMKHEDVVYSAQFSPDGQRVVTASGDRTAQLWDALKGKPIGEAMKHEDVVYSAQFSPDGQRVVTASGDKTARVWNALRGKPIGEAMKHEDVVYSAQFSPDGQRVVTASADKTARVWDALRGKPIGEPMEHQNEVFSAQFSPDGQRIVTASRDTTARVWDAPTGEQIVVMMEGAGVNSAQFSPDGQRVVTASADRTARIWDARTGEQIVVMMEGAGVNSAQFSPDGQWVVTASADGTARVWDTRTGKLLQRMVQRAGISSAQFSPDGQRVVTASADRTAHLWDAASGAIGEPMQHEAMVNSAQFSPDGQRVVTASRDKTARVWDAANGKPIGEPMQHEGNVFSAQFSPDGKLVITASLDKTARVWDAATGKPIGQPIKHEAAVYSAQFSPDGQRVVTASEDKTARLWDVVILTGEDTIEDIFLLAELAEAAGGLTFETVGDAENFKSLAPEQARASRGKVAAKFLGPSSKLTSLQRVMKWSVSDRRSRTISPFLQLTVSDWLESTIKEGTIEGLRVALQIDPTNVRVTAHLGRRLADQALKEGSDPDEARRARAEADFLTSRAVKLAPANDGVKKLRDEVVKLLELKTN